MSIDIRLYMAFLCHSGTQQNVCVQKSVGWWGMYNIDRNPYDMISQLYSIVGPFDYNNNCHTFLDLSSL